MIMMRSGLWDLLAKACGTLLAPRRGRLPPPHAVCEVIAAVPLRAHSAIGVLSVTRTGSGLRGGSAPAFSRRTGRPEPAGRLAADGGVLLTALPWDQALALVKPWHAGLAEFQQLRRLTIDGVHSRVLPGQSCGGILR
jgi:hypothetical protein